MSIERWWDTCSHIHTTTESTSCSSITLHFSADDLIYRKWHSLHSSILVVCLFVASILKFAHIKCVCVGVFFLFWEKHSRVTKKHLFIQHITLNIIKHINASCLRIQTPASEYFPCFQNVLTLGKPRVAKISKSAFKSQKLLIYIFNKFSSNSSMTKWS